MLAFDLKDRQRCRVDDEDRPTRRVNDHSATDRVADRTLQHLDYHREAEQSQRPQKRQHNDCKIEKVVPEPPTAGICQIEPREVVRHEN